MDKSKNHNPFAEENIEELNLEENNNINETEATSEEEVVEKTEENKEAAAQNNEYEELKNQYVRLAADFDNYRKRQAQEREALLKYGLEDTLKKLLPIIDSFDRAKKALSETDDPQKVKEGFDVISKQFVEALSKIGLKQIETEDKEFDPNLHEAVMQTPTSEKPENTIVQELQKGYMVDGKVIRPALVSVAVAE